MSAPEEFREVSATKLTILTQTIDQLATDMEVDSDYIVGLDFDHQISFAECRENLQRVRRQLLLIRNDLR